MLDPEIVYAFLFTPKDKEDFIKHLEMLREYYDFKKIPNNYIKQRSRLPQDFTDIRLQKKYDFPIKEKEIVLEFIASIEQEYHIPQIMSRKYISVNYTEKPSLPWDFKKVNGVEFDMPITTQRQLLEVARELRKYYFFYRLLENWINIKIENRVNWELTGKNRYLMI